MFVQNLRHKLLIATAMVLIPVISFCQLVTSHSSTTASSGSAMAPSFPIATGKVVARVNGVALTDRDLLQKMYVIFPYAKQHNGFPKGMEKEIEHGALKMIVFEELCYQEAVRRNMTVAPARIAKVRAEIHADVHNPQGYAAVLKDYGDGTEAGLTKRIRRMLLIRDFVKAEITDKSAVSPGELKAFYDKNLNSFRVPEMVSFQTISIVPPPNSDSEIQAEAHQRAEEVLRQAKAADTYEKFGLLAEKVSEDDFRVNMGYRKPVEVAKLPASIAKVLTSMKPGQISGIVAIDGGYTILRLIKVDPPTIRKFADIRPALKNYLHEKKQEELRTALDSKLRAKAKVEELL